jgi:hypothetical protein
MNCLKYRVVAKTLCLATNIITFQLTTYIHFKDVYYV